MKVCVVSHSLIHPRQYRFFEHLEAAFGIQTKQIYPENWGSLHRDGGYQVDSYDAAYFGFPESALSDVKAFKPDIIYAQQEFYSRVTKQFFHLSKQIDCRFGVFVWENLDGRYDFSHKKMIADTDFIVCGSEEAQELVASYNSKTTVMPQVGLDTWVFKPLDTVPKSYDLVFVGRAKEEKGRGLIQRGVLERSDYTILDVVNADYDSMPLFYNQAKVHLSPTFDTLTWHEQHASYANLEALSCGLRVVTSNSRAIVEYLSQCPGVQFIPQGDADALLEKVKLSLQDWRPNLEGRDFVDRNFSMPSIAKKLSDVFSNA